MQTPPGLDQGDETDLDAQEDDETDFHDGDGYLEPTTLRVKAGDRTIEVVAPDAETVSDLLKLGLDAMGKMGAGVQ